LRTSTLLTDVLEKHCCRLLPTGIRYGALERLAVLSFVNEAYICTLVSICNLIWSPLIQSANLLDGVLPQASFICQYFAIPL